MTLSFSQKEVQAIVRAEMMKFSKEYLIQIEKSVHLFEKVEAIEGHVTKLTEKVNKLQSSVSKCVPIIDNLENTVQAIKLSIESDASKTEYLRFIEQRVKENVIALRADLFEDLKEKGAKTSDIKDPVKKIKEEMKRLEVIVKEGLARAEIKIHENDLDIRKMIYSHKSKIEAKALGIDKIYSQLNEGMSVKLDELVKLISEKFVSKISFDSTKTELSNQIIGFSQGVANLKNSLLQVQHLNSETNKILSKSNSKESFQNKFISNSIESKLEKINHVC